jgi:hypothetical protein
MTRTKTLSDFSRPLSAHGCGVVLDRSRGRVGPLGLGSVLSGLLDECPVWPCSSLCAGLVDQASYGKGRL